MGEARISEWEGPSAVSSPPRHHSHLGAPPGVVLGIAAIVSGVLLWQLLVNLHAFAPYLLPAPADVLGTWWQLAGDGVLWRHVSVTLTEALLGFVLALLAGAPLGYLLARSSAFFGLLSPYVAATQAMPIIALAPLLVVWLGLGLLPKVVISALVVFFPITVNVAVGLRTIDRSIWEAARSEGASTWQSLYHVELPLAARTVLGGVRMALTLSLTGAIVAEFVSSDAGLGYLMTLARSEYDAPLLFAASLTMIALAVAGYLLTTLLEHVLIDWD